MYSIGKIGPVEKGEISQGMSCPEVANDVLHKQNSYIMKILK
jgi:hypothetical protein